LYKVTVPERRAIIGDSTGIGADAVAEALDGGGLDAETADKFVENVLGTYALPYGVVPNVRVNGRDHTVPVVIEEPSVVAAASNAAKMVRAGGGFFADADPPLMIAQVQLRNVRDAEGAARRILAQAEEIVRLANRSLEGLVARGGGARRVEARVLAADVVVAHVLVDCRDAMGANLVNGVAEAVSDRVAQIAAAGMPDACSVGLRILSNLCDNRCVRVRCRVPVDQLATERMSGSDIADGIANASRFAELDAYRAATHNKGIMNGIDAVVLATGNDWRAVEAGAHAFAARSGRYLPLAVWRHDGDAVVGQLEMPLALGIVGGTLRVHPAARLSLRLLGVTSAQELACVVGAVGLASNLAAVRALASDGIQRGHMGLHARTVALAAGAAGEQVEAVAAMIVEARDITLEGARRALAAVAAEAGGHGEPTR